MNTFLTVIGGIGLFLLGMSLMTDGLKALAGNALKQLLSKFTGGIFSAIFSGAAITALIQSSSATTFMTIGFVSAGLLTFGQSIGVIIGANLGSTSTGWIVSLIGFKVNMGAVALPLIGVGVFLKMFSKGKLAPHGMALAGFGLLFLGIDVLQQGMSGLGDSFNLGAFAGDSFWNKIILIIFGVVMTVVMQSSSAAVVTTLTALYTGAITFDQAAVLVIGQNVGTTVKAMIAAIGSSVPAKQTAVAHILFNLLTGLIAFLALPLIISFVFILSGWLNITDLAVSLALFHTVFNLIGVVIIIAILPLFIKLVIRVVPDHGDELTKHLDPSVAVVASVAIEAARRTLIKVTKKVSATAQQLFTDKKVSPTMLKELAQADNALNEVRNFLSKVNDQTTHMTKREYKNHLAIIHAVDHLDRLIKALGEGDFVEHLKTGENVTNLASRLTEVLVMVETEITNEDMSDLVQLVEDHSKQTAEIRRKDRKKILKTSAKSQINIDSAIQTVHTIHWIDRIAYHLWRSVHHLNDFKQTATETDDEATPNDSEQKDKNKTSRSY